MKSKSQTEFKRNCCLSPPITGIYSLKGSSKLMNCEIAKHFFHSPQASNAFRPSTHL